MTTVSPTLNLVAVAVCLSFFPVGLPFLSYMSTGTGVAHNKLLAKLCSNMHKPNAQTVLPGDMVPRVFRELPVERVKGWGGKFGVCIMETLGVSTAGMYAYFPQQI